MFLIEKVAYFVNIWLLIKKVINWKPAPPLNKNLIYLKYTEFISSVISPRCQIVFNTSPAFWRWGPGPPAPPSPPSAACRSGWIWCVRSSAWSWRRLSHAAAAAACCSAPACLRRPGPLRPSRSAAPPPPQEKHSRWCSLGAVGRLWTLIWKPVYRHSGFY